MLSERRLTQASVHFDQAEGLRRLLLRASLRVVTVVGQRGGQSGGSADSGGEKSFGAG
jgi:hypothetical protein